jgi:hypothetical protein
MSAVATHEPRVGRPEGDSAEPPAARLFEPKGPTLEDAILATWAELSTSDRVACPVCGGAMSRTNGCQACGSELS